MSHTPGPWAYGMYDSGGYRVTGPDDGLLVALGHTTAKEADARLIAAAPALLEAVKDMMNWVDLRYLNETEKARFDAHVAAIQQAEGVEVR